jgi:hypothetical protein
MSSVQASGLNVAGLNVTGLNVTHPLNSYRNKKKQQLIDEFGFDLSLVAVWRIYVQRTYTVQVYTIPPPFPVSLRHLLC